MRFLADENLHGDIIAWLRSKGHDVRAAFETMRGNADDELLDIARREERILITDDKDFGELVFRRKLATHGVILMRLSDATVAARIARLERAWPTVEMNSPGRFIVINDRKLRIRTILPTD